MTGAGGYVIRRLFINKGDLSSLHNGHHVVDHQCFLKENERQAFRNVEYLLRNKNSCWVFKRALRKERPNAVDCYGPDTAKTVNAPFA
jgi:hypothetical protein